MFFLNKIYMTITKSVYNFYYIYYYDHFHYLYLLLFISVFSFVFGTILYYEPYEL